MPRRLASAVFLFLAALPVQAGPAADLARAIRQAGLDPGECYRVRDLTLAKEDVQIYLSDGYLIFSKPVAGHRIAAVFTTNVENGDGEVLLLPPNGAERRSLASYTGVPNLDQHFREAIFLFTGDVYHELIKQLPANPTNRKAPEMGAVLQEKWDPVLHNLAASDSTRLTLDLLNSAARQPDLLSGIFSSAKLGNFDILYDPDNSDQIAAGQVNEREGRTFFDIWTHFPSRSARNGKALPRPRFDLSDYRIQSTVDPDLSLSAVTRVKVRVSQEGTAAVPFDIARAMEVTAVTVDGKPAEVLQREAVRSNVGRGDNELFLVVPPEPLHAGRDYDFEFHHSGRVIVQTGDRIFYVAARGNWYPSIGLQSATFDLTFRYPRDLELVTPGDVLEDRTEGEWRITRRRPAAPIMMAGFNLGDYAHARVERAGFVVDVCGNRVLEPDLQPHPVLPPPPPPATRLGRRGRRVPLELPNAITPPPVDPLARLQKLANDVTSALVFMTSKFGPPPLSHLTVSPIPATFGQGFPGLIYLSTHAYVSPEQTRMAAGDALFFDELLQAHETAHQWWGGLVHSASYRDDWLMEALANYSALLFLEQRGGVQETDTLLQGYREALLTKSPNGQIVDATGPIVLGTRLETSSEPRAWRVITYGKGSWILQMLRKRMGDQRFFAMLSELIKRFAHGDLSTEQFRALAAQFLPPRSDDPQLEDFFDQWVYGTGIPALKLTYSLKGRAPAYRLTVRLTQSEVGEDFSALTPIEIQMPRGQSVTRWLRSASEPSTMTVTLRQPPLKVLLDPHNAVLRR